MTKRLAWILFLKQWISLQKKWYIVKQSVRAYRVPLCVEMGKELTVGGLRGFIPIPSGGVWMEWTAEVPEKLFFPSAPPSFTYEKTFSPFALSTAIPNSAPPPMRKRRKMDTTGGVFLCPSVHTILLLGTSVRTRLNVHVS